MRQTDSEPACYHLDTNYLHSYLIRLNGTVHPESDQRRLAQDVVRWLRNQDYQLKISALSIGEFVSELVKGNAKDNGTKNDNMLYDFYSMVKAKEFRICCVEKSELSLFSKLIGEISSRDYLMHATDVLIVAQGMADGDCCGLLTFEGKLHNNKGIDEVRKDTLMGRKFRVTDDPRKK